jgi:hypothetical protein
MLEADVPDFERAIAQFRRLLAEHSLPTEIVWAFREDLYAPLSRFRVKFPPPRENESLVKRLFEKGRVRGLVEISALCRLPSAVVATIWFPATSDEDVQGWSHGLKLAIHSPLTEATPIHSAFSWCLRKLLPAYRLYQDHAEFVASRARVAV